MIRKPDVILLDEATSALDTENEALVQEALDEFARRGSALVIAHRLSTVMDSDKIVVVDHGRKAEEGRHDELLAKPHDADAAAADDDDEITSHEPPALERERTAPTPSIDSLALAADDDDASASSAPPKLQHGGRRDQRRYRQLAQAARAAASVVPAAVGGRDRLTREHVARSHAREGGADHEGARAAQRQDRPHADAKSGTAHGRAAGAAVRRQVVPRGPAGAKHRDYRGGYDVGGRGGDVQC